MFLGIFFKRHRPLFRGSSSTVATITRRPYLIQIIGDAYKKNMTYARKKKNAFGTYTIVCVVSVVYANEQCCSSDHLTF